MAEVSIFLSQHQELKRYPIRGGIVRCSLSGHEMPCRLEVLQSYVAGKKFVRLRAEAGFNYKSLEPLIVSSVKRRNRLYCTLTNRYVNRKPAAVEGHLMGKRYKKALEKYNAGELKLFKEKVKDVSHTQENADCRDGDISDVCAPRDRSDSETERNGMKADSNNSSGDAEKTRHSSDLDEPAKSFKRKRDSTIPAAKKLKVAKKAKQRRMKT